jgi:hypothetical protein
VGPPPASTGRPLSTAPLSPVPPSAALDAHGPQVPLVQEVPGQQSALLVHAPHEETHCAPLQT